MGSQTDIHKLLPDQTFFTLDEDGSVTAWMSIPNSAFNHGSVCIGQPFVALFPDFELDTISAVLKERPTVPETLVIVMRTGRKTWVRTELVIVFNEVSRAWMGSVRDMTDVENSIILSADERAQMEADAEASQATLREWNVELRTQIQETNNALKELWNSREATQSIIEQAYNAYVSTDDEGVIREWNTAAERMFGWSRSEILGRNLTETIIPEQYREVHIAGMKHFTTTGIETLMNKRVEIEALDRTGHVIPVELTFWHTKVHDKYVFHAFLHDIGARKRITMEMSQFFELSLDLMSVSSLETGLFTRVNKAWERDMGWKKDDLVGTPALDLVHPDDLERVTAIRDSLPKNRAVIGYATRLRRADGGFRVVNWKASYSVETGLVYTVGHIVEQRQVKR